MGQVTHQKTYSKIYRTWTSMLSRCRNKKDPNYKNYGARGIFVNKDWYKFENFYKDMGDLPFYEAQLDRINNEDGYYKENCRWVTPKQNSRNRRSSKKIGDIIQVELIEKIGWTKNQFRWFSNRYGISWILEGFKKGILPQKTNVPIDKEDLIGKKINSWTVIKFVSYKRSEGNRYLCKCECGVEKEVVGYYLRSGKSTKCRSCAAYKNNLGKYKRRSSCKLPISNLSTDL